MPYLTAERMAAIDSAAFQYQYPFPWMTIDRFVPDHVFEQLCDQLPDMSLFSREFGRKRGYGQESHNRHVLQYRDDLEVPLVWRQFIAELKGPAYQSFLRKMFALKSSEKIVLTMHWHLAGSGCAVSPHVDASRKIGSHIFYLHRGGRWLPEWGGQTLVLDDAGRFSPRSAPSFEELKQVASSTIMDNHSFMFQRTDWSWHGVRPIACPEGELRKVFIVVINRVTWQVRWRHLRGKDADGYPLRGHAHRR
jgi:hypothetical protein